MFRLSSVTTEYSGELEFQGGIAKQLELLTSAMKVLSRTTQCAGNRQYSARRCLQEFTPEFRLLLTCV